MSHNWHSIINVRQCVFLPRLYEVPLDMASFITPAMAREIGMYTLLGATTKAVGVAARAYDYRNDKHMQTQAIRREMLVVGLTGASSAVLETVNAVGIKLAKEGRNAPAFLKKMATNPTFNTAMRYGLIIPAIAAAEIISRVLFPVKPVATAATSKTELVETKATIKNNARHADVSAVHVAAKMPSKYFGIFFDPAGASGNTFSGGSPINQTLPATYAGFNTTTTPLLQHQPRVTYLA